MAAMSDANNNVMHKNRATFRLIERFLQLQAQNNADESPKKPKGSRKMTGRWGKTTGRWIKRQGAALSFRPSENPGIVLFSVMCSVTSLLNKVTSLQKHRSEY